MGSRINIKTLRSKVFERTEDNCQRTVKDDFSPLCYEKSSILKEHKFLLLFMGTLLVSNYLKIIDFRYLLK
ncbi:hypothetical protein B5S50_01020 [Clostridium sp. 001]|nr:hypothetical protein B5S50_01020 [Clostridium sp. 001]